MAVIITDLETFAAVLDRAFPPQQDAHVRKYWLVMRNRANEAFRIEFGAYVKAHGFSAALKHYERKI